jgi:hypothetical protein
MRPQTQGKNRMLALDTPKLHFIENYFLPGDLEQQIEAFVGH